MKKNIANTPTPLDSLSAETKNSATLRKGDMHASTAQTLRNLIVAGAIGPGDKLNERELCERLNVSRTPVREAIKTLAQEGLLDISPNRSPTVTRLDAEETTALIDVVSAIEALAGELAAARITEAEIAELGILHYTMLKHRAQDELPDYFKANKAFHRLILEYSGNPVLLWVWDLLALRIDRARYTSNLWPERWDKAMVEHGAILERIKQHDSPGAAKAMKSHVQNGLSIVVKSIREQSKPAKKKISAPAKST
jgi:DNA-binding GntR family transcriptional regulator